MRKIIKLILAALLMMTAMLLCACSASFYMSYEDRDYEILEETVSLETIEALEIHWSCGDVNIVTSKDDGVTISETFVQNNGTSDRAAARYRLSNGRLIVQFCESGAMLSGVEKDLTVTLPDSPVALSDIEVDAALGEIHVDSLTAENIDIDTASGNVTMRSVSAGDINVDMASTSLVFQAVTVTRSIRVDCASSEILMTETKAKAFELNGVSCDVDFDGSLEVIELDATSADARFTIFDGALSEFDGDFTSGNVMLYLPESIDGFNAEADGLSMAFSSDFDTVRRDEEYRYGNGRAEINVEGVSGSLAIRKIKE